MKDEGRRTTLKAPFPYFGGKSAIAAEVWARFGEVRNYVEPFFGSGATLLARPMPFDGCETVNDADGMIANFWRAVQDDPEKVARHADWPVNENDLHARHAWLVARKDSLQQKLEGSPTYYDARIAGWWCWGMSCWIGSGFCSGRGPWGVRNRQLVHLGNAGMGVNRQRVHLGNAGMGVNRQLVHLGNAGKGVNRQRVHLGDAGRGENGVREWIEALSTRLARVRVCCGDWRRVCGGKTGDALRALFSGGDLCAVFLDPPYSAAADREMDLYTRDSGEVACDARQWAIEHGDDPRLRIALCGYRGEHRLPKGWLCLPWKARGGYAVGTDNANCQRERIWFSPHCLRKNRVRAA